MPHSIPRDRLESLLTAAARVRIAVIGDAMLDIYLHGDVDRISPEAPVPVVRVRERRAALGGAANVAQNVRAIGAACELIAVIGDDRPGRQVAELLESIGAETRSLVKTERRTTSKTRVMARNQQMLRFDEEDDHDVVGEDAARLGEAADRAIRQADALILEDYNKGVLSTPLIERAMKAARERKIPIVIDPKYRNFFAYRGATVFKPNRRELESALGAAFDLEHPETLPATLQRLGAEHVLLTLGEHGMVLASADGTLHRVPTTARDVYDVSGAGDTVTAYLAASLAAGATPREAAVIANYAAGVEVGKLGAATVSAEEVLGAYDHFAGAART